VALPAELESKPANRTTRLRRRPTAPLWSSTDDRWSLAARIGALMVVVLLVASVPLWGLTVRSAEETARRDAIARAQSTAVALAASSWVEQAVLSSDPTAALSASVEQTRAGNDLLFVVVMSPEGIRWTHPDPAQIGGRYVGSIESARSGQLVVEDFVGTLGPSVRVVVPIKSGNQIIALVAVGVSLDSVQRVGAQRVQQFLLLFALSMLVGLVGTWLIARQVRRQTRGLGPIGLGRLQSYYDSVLHSLRAGLVLVGTDGTVVLCNDEARELIGTPVVSTGQRVSDLWLDPELAELMTSGRDCDGEIFVEDGRALVVTQRRAVFEGEDLGWVTTLRDRTDLVRLTGELDSLRSFSDMLRSRAHEADNRLHTVIMLVELGRSNEAIEFATATIERSQALVDAVTGAVRDAPVAALLLGKFAQAEERGVTLVLADDLEVPSTGVAAIDLLVALGNLIDNAVDAAAEGPEPRWVEVAGRVDRSSPASQMILQVTDSGSGVPPDRIGNAFTRGWSTKEYDADDRPQGRGIGLSLVSGAVRRLGGSLAVTTEPSRFELRLPLPERSDELATEQP